MKGSTVERPIVKNAVTCKEEVWRQQKRRCRLCGGSGQCRIVVKYCDVFVECPRCKGLGEASTEHNKKGPTDSEKNELRKK